MKIFCKVLAKLFNWLSCLYVLTSQLYTTARVKKYRLIKCLVYEFQAYLKNPVFVPTWGLFYSNYLRHLCVTKSTHRIFKASTLSNIITESFDFLTNNVLKFSFFLCTFGWATSMPGTKKVPSRINSFENLEVST